MVSSIRGVSANSGDRSDVKPRVSAGLWPIIASASGALVSALVLAVEFPLSLVLGWASLAVLSHGASFVGWRIYGTAPRLNNPDRWLRYSTVSGLAIGITWGTLAIMVPAGANNSEALIYGLGFGAMAGAAIAHPRDPLAANATLWPISISFVLASCWMGDRAHLMTAFLLVLFCAAMSLLGQHLDRMHSESLAARGERERMAAELAAGKSRIAAANAELAHANQRLESANDDLTKAHSEAEAASRAKSEFLANMSHELRTPLNAIIGFAEVIERETFGPTNPRYREYASDIHGSGKHLLQVINDILDLAKVEAGQMLLHEARLDPALVMQGCVRLIKPRAAKSNVRIYTAFDPNLPVLQADEARLRQIGLNLLSNAVKFTKAGGRVSISTGLDEAGGITISVADTGIGMTPDEIRIALEPFRQVTSSLSRTNEGTGLGLPLTKTLVELHGGRLDIASVPGRGTTVTVSFPPSRSLAQLPELAVQNA